MNHEEFIEKGKELVAQYSANYFEADDVYVVWSVKALQNSKALMSTPESDGMYYELTMNGDKGEIYFDAYKKQENICVSI